MLKRSLLNVLKLHNHISLKVTTHTKNFSLAKTFSQKWTFASRSEQLPLKFIEIYIMQEPTNEEKLTEHSLFIVELFTYEMLHSLLEDRIFYVIDKNSIYYVNKKLTRSCVRIDTNVLNFTPNIPNTTADPSSKRNSIVKALDLSSAVLNATNEMPFSQMLSVDNLKNIELLTNFTPLKSFVNYGTEPYYFFNYYKAVATLLEQGYDPNINVIQADGDTWLPFILNCMFVDNLNLVKLLIEHDAKFEFHRGTILELFIDFVSFGCAVIYPFKNPPYLEIFKYFLHEKRTNLNLTKDRILTLAEANKGLLIILLKNFPELCRDINFSTDHLLRKAVLDIAFQLSPYENEFIEEIRKLCRDLTDTEFHPHYLGTEFLSLLNQPDSNIDELNLTSSAPKDSNSKVVVSDEQLKQLPTAMRYNTRITRITLTFPHHFSDNTITYLKKLLVHSSLKFIKVDFSQQSEDRTEAFCTGLNFSRNINNLQAVMFILSAKMQAKSINSILKQLNGGNALFLINDLSYLSTPKRYQVFHFSKSRSEVRLWKLQHDWQQALDSVTQNLTEDEQARKNNELIDLYTQFQNLQEWVDILYNSHPDYRVGRSNNILSTADFVLRFRENAKAFFLKISQEFFTHCLQLGELDWPFELLVSKEIFFEKNVVLMSMKSLGIAFYARSSDQNDDETRIEYLIKALMLLAWTQCYSHDYSILDHIKFILLSISAVLNYKLVQLNAEFDLQTIAHELIMSKYWRKVVELVDQVSPGSICGPKFLEYVFLEKNFPIISLRNYCQMLTDHSYREQYTHEVLSSQLNAFGQILFRQDFNLSGSESLDARPNSPRKRKIEQTFTSSTYRQFSNFFQKMPRADFDSNNKYACEKDKGKEKQQSSDNFSRVNEYTKSSDNSLRYEDEETESPHSGTRQDSL